MSLCRRKAFSKSWSQESPKHQCSGAVPHSATTAIDSTASAAPKAAGTRCSAAFSGSSVAANTGLTQGSSVSGSQAGVPCPQPEKAQWGHVSPWAPLCHPEALTECAHRSVQIHTHTQTTQQSHRWNSTAIRIAPVLRIQGQEHRTGLFFPNPFIQQVFAEQ